MQQQPTYSAALTNRSIPIVSRTPSAKCQFTGILNHNDLATDYTRRRARSRMARHLCNTYPFIAQKTREPNLLGPVPCKASNAGARTSNEGRMQRRPPFSRRRSPNRPSATSIDIKPPSARPIPTRESVSTKLRNQKKMCAFDSRSSGFLVSVIGGVASTDLTPTAEVSGPHDFAVRIKRPRQKHFLRPPHPAPRQ